MEKTLILVKPDGVQRGLIGEIIGRFERKGLKLVGLKMMKAGDALVLEHYAHIADKPFFGEISKYIQSSPIVAMVWEGTDVIDAVRLLVGPTKASTAMAGTIRGDLALSMQNNVVHASDSAESAVLEVERFFDASELFSYDKTEYQHVYGS
jgi:nucleoside-diphosphate kinase